MSKARRALAATLVVGMSAVALTACFPLPPALPSAPPTPTIPQPADPATDPAVPATEPADPGTQPTEQPAAPSGDLPFTVDDGLGDTWSFGVSELVTDPPMESGEAESGTYFVGVVIDAQHVEGDASFATCFDILVQGSDGTVYDWADTIQVTAENDVYYADDSGFTGAVAAVQLPEGVEPTQVVLRSAYGHPAVADTVIDVQ